MDKGRSEGAAAPQEEEAFAGRLRRMREAAGLTQEELAFRAGLSPSAVGVLERGARKRPYPHTVRALADALGLDEDGLAALLAAVPGRGKAVGASSASGDAPEPARSPALPNPATPLVGRAGEVAEVTDLIGRPDVRLLTLTGVGGVGKTRLALAAAREAAPSFEDGEAFVGLAPVGDPALVVPTVARALGLTETGGQTPFEALTGGLRERRLLLVLDNLEHLLGAAPEVAALIEACPDLTVLATSRAPLRVRGEREYPVSPLGLPPTTRTPTGIDVAGSASGQLFLERAGAASPSFAITEVNAADVAAICWRLAGLPLALELAAAKTRFLEPGALLSRLDQALSAAWARDLPERQRTMRAALDWSHDLLAGPERALFRRLSVFVGGFSLEAAEAVGATGEPGEVLGLLGTLVEQSLVAVRPPEEGGGARYGMLEPVGQYALESLEQSGEAETVRRLHAAFFLELAERAEPELLGPDQSEWLGRLEGEHDNLRAAFAWALGAAGDAPTAARLGWALQVFLWVRGHHREGRRWMEATLRRGLPDALRARALQVAAGMSYAQGDYPVAEGRYREAARLSRREGDETVEGHARAGVGLVQMARSEHEAAMSSLEGAISLFERCGENYGAAVTRVWLGSVLLARGEGQRAEGSFEEALAWVRAANTPTLTVAALYGLAQSAVARDDHAEADRLLEEAVGLSAQTGDRANLAHLLGTLAAVRTHPQAAERSAVLLGAAECLLEEVGARVYNQYAPDLSVYERAVATARSRLGDPAFEEAREQGRAMTFEEAVGYALRADEKQV